MTTIALQSKRQNPNRLDFYSHFKVTLGSCGQVCGQVSYIKMKRPFVQCSPEPDNIHMGSAWLHVGESVTPQRKGTKKPNKDM